MGQTMAPVKEYVKIDNLLVNKENQKEPKRMNTWQSNVSNKENVNSRKSNEDRIKIKYL